MSFQTHVAAGLARLASAIVALKAQVDGLGGGGAAAPLQATLQVSPVALSGVAEVVLVHPGAAPGDLVRVSLVAEADAENDVEELMDSDMRVAGIAEAGQVRFVLFGQGAFAGDFKILYEVFNQ